MFDNRQVIACRRRGQVANTLRVVAVIDVEGKGRREIAITNYNYSRPCERKPLQYLYRRYGDTERRSEYFGSARIHT